jgi:RNA polymerase sigma factor for flagellar operon FliA
VPAKSLRARLQAAYAEQSRAQFEERLIVDHLPMVRHIVQKVTTHLPWRPDVDDLISAGTLGLVRAARHFDSSRQVAFSTYAYIRIRGAVIDELRQRSFVSSEAHARIRAIRSAYEECVSAAGRPPTDEELIRRLGMSRQEYYRTLEEARNQQFLSIHGLSDEGPALPSFLPADTIAPPDEQLERKELIEGLSRAIQELPEKERLTILLYYERDLTMREAGQVLKISESRVSQLHASALFKLSMKLRDLQ